MDIHEAGLLPNGRYGFGHKDSVGTPSKRHDAVKSVLTTLPEDMYRKFVLAMQSASWFVPMKELWGKVGDVPNQRFIYLSPLLEFAEDWMVESIAAHEIFHLILDHKLEGCSADEDARQEAEVKMMMEKLDYRDPKTDLTGLFNRLFPS